MAADSHDCSFLDVDCSLMKVIAMSRKAIINMCYIDITRSWF